MWAFTERADPQVVNKRALESLVKCGALDSTGATRRGMWEALEPALSWGGQQQADRLAGQSSIFDLGDEPAESRPRHHAPLATEEWEKSERLGFEKESLGLYVSEHPLDSVKASLRKKTDCPIAELERRRDGEVVTVGGIVGALKNLTTKKGEPMVFMRLDDLSGSVETVEASWVTVTVPNVPGASTLLVCRRLSQSDGNQRKVLLRKEL